MEEHLRLGALAGRGESAERLNFLFDLFPVLKERMHTPARRLSGGQQQMVAMARALASDPPSPAPWTAPPPTPRTRGHRR